MKDCSAKERAFQGENPTGAGAPALDNIANKITPINVYSQIVGAKCLIDRPKTAESGLVERFANQAAAREILGRGHRLSNCLRARARGATAVPVYRNPETASTAYGQLQTCGSVWACPVCAQKITHQRREELQALTSAHLSAGGGVYLMTRTIPHGQWDCLGDLMSKLGKAEMKFRMGKPWKRLLSTWGIVGSVRAKEITIGLNGWHPHLHDLVLTARPLDSVALVQMERAMFERWETATGRAGFGAISPAAFSLQNGDKAAAYVSKFGVEHELTSHHVKHAFGASVTPFDLLRVVVQGHGENAVQAAYVLFREYVKHTHGKRFLTWTKGLRERYNLAPEKADEDLAAETDPVSAVLGVLSLFDWLRILKANRRAEVLNVARSGDWSAVAAYVATLPEIERAQGDGPGCGRLRPRRVRPVGVASCA